MRAPIIETELAFARGMNPNEGVMGFVIHQTGAEDIDPSADDINQWHIGNGWSGIGYHFVIRKSGDVERGRPEDCEGAHAPGRTGLPLASMSPAALSASCRTKHSCSRSSVSWPTSASSTA